MIGGELELMTLLGFAIGYLKYSTIVHLQASLISLYFFPFLRHAD